MAVICLLLGRSAQNFRSAHVLVLPYNVPSFTNFYQELSGLEQKIQFSYNSRTHAVYLGQNMEYVVDAIKILRNLVYAKTNAGSSVIETRFFWRVYGFLGISLRILYFSLCKHLNIHETNGPFPFQTKF